MPGEGQPTAARCLCCLIPETFRLAHHYRPIMTFISHLDLGTFEIVALLRMMFLMLPPSHPRLDSYRECSVAVRHPLGHVLYLNKL